MATANAKLPEGAKARRVYMSIREDISNGLHPVGSALPGEQKLAALYDVSRVTIRRALDSLCAEGIVKRLPGSGTVVRSNPSSSEPVAMNFSTLMPQLSEMSKNTTAQLLSFTYGYPPAHVATAMGISQQSKVQIATRVRRTDGNPFSYLTTYVPESIAANYSESDLATTPLYVLLERGGVQIDSAQQSVSATLASPDIATALDIAVGSALIALQRVVRDSAGQGVEYLSAKYRPDLFRLDMDLTRVNEGSARQWQPVLHSGNTPISPEDNTQIGAMKSSSSDDHTEVDLPAQKRASV